MDDAIAVREVVTFFGLATIASNSGRVMSFFTLIDPPAFLAY